ncbi:MAG: type I glyceraldehyde-3-phosphate dehydrogenase [Candidatus Colwellbacteria bacterium RIFCSPLOWO2_01_FULL_48_10]|uniref:Type I glyceraldehyde-3-phosphate dehydrogenase n=2 Tax=Bacteria candidate phyla TaxID=1783234 RepID=A0A1F5P311_9BACT|nr:MAG: type I glyceraldehyde-3-phosphate dehydrogenase [Candidatus Doudnabacteria bacterium RIFCSPHIGHO2_01_FULL_49_9]OGY60091.1 MAG: type I glyceraldehyde-3-phosphate dehydrogenase [Candidatus Colwellbacteria bacterium RIFCSPLOWO2_01_FULL_48_10]
MTRIAINGFGRIGRLFLRQLLASPLASQVEVVAVNDLGDVTNLAYLLKYDTVYRAYDKSVEVKGADLVIYGQPIKFLQEKDATKLPWKDLGVDLVVESTGAFESYEKAKAHLDAGAKKVLITAPAKDEDSALGNTVLVGVNDKDFGKCAITSNGSCTTNASAPVVAIMSESVGVKKAILNTVHAYTATQNLVDGPVKGTDLRRGRAGAQNIAPSTTGAAIAITRIIPKLKDKFDGIAFRVPVAAGSAANITFVAGRPTTVEEVNQIFRDAAKSPRWKATLAVTEDQLVSSDIVGNPYGAIIDLKFTKVIDGDLVNILSWYDNEYGYVSTLVKHVEKLVAL